MDPEERASPLWLTTAFNAQSEHGLFHGYFGKKAKEYG